MGGPASPSLYGAARIGLRDIRPRAAGRRRRRGDTARDHPWRESEDRLAVGCVLDAEGGPGHSGIAATAPGAGAGIRTTAERAGDLPDGAVPRLGGGALPGTRGAAGRVRQRAGTPGGGGSGPPRRTVVP